MNTKFFTTTLRFATVTFFMLDLATAMQDIAGWENILQELQNEVEAIFEEESQAVTSSDPEYDAEAEKPKHADPEELEEQPTSIRGDKFDSLAVNAGEKTEPKVVSETVSETKPVAAEKIKVEAPTGDLKDRLEKAESVSSEKIIEIIGGEDARAEKQNVPKTDKLTPEEYLEFFQKEAETRDSGLNLGEYVTIGNGQYGQLKWISGEFVGVKVMGVKRGLKTENTFGGKFGIGFKSFQMNELNVGDFALFEKKDASGTPVSQTRYRVSKVKVDGKYHKVIGNNKGENLQYLDALDKKTRRQLKQLRTKWKTGYYFENSQFKIVNRSEISNKSYSKQGVQKLGDVYAVEEETIKCNTKPILSRNKPRGKFQYRYGNGSWNRAKNGGDNNYVSNMQFYKQCNQRNRGYRSY